MAEGTEDNYPRAEQSNDLPLPTKVVKVKKQRINLKRRKLLANLKNCSTIAEASKKAGYSYKARNMYRANTKKHITSFLDKTNPTPDEIVSRFTDILERTQTKEDYNNALRALENLGKLKGMYIDKVESKQDVSIHERTKSLLDTLGTIYNAPNLRRDAPRIDKLIQGNVGDNLGNGEIDSNNTGC